MGHHPKTQSKWARMGYICFQKKESESDLFWNNFQIVIFSTPSLREVYATFHMLRNILMRRALSRKKINKIVLFGQVCFRKVFLSNENVSLECLTHPRWTTYLDQSEFTVSGNLKQSPLFFHRDGFGGKRMSCSLNR